MFWKRRKQAQLTQTDNQQISNQRIAFASNKTRTLVYQQIETNFVLILNQLNCFRLSIFLYGLYYMQIPSGFKPQPKYLCAIADDVGRVPQYWVRRPNWRKEVAKNFTLCQVVLFLGSSTSSLLSAYFQTISLFALSSRVKRATSVNLSTTFKRSSETISVTSTVQRIS